jgi:choline-glycine betaine transporter
VRVLIAGTNAGDFHMNFFGGLFAYAQENCAAQQPCGPCRHGLLAWTTFYWAWWIQLVPFVGMFIARVGH